MHNTTAHKPLAPIASPTCEFKPDRSSNSSDSTKYPTGASRILRPTGLIVLLLGLGLMASKSLADMNPLVLTLPFQGNWVLVNPAFDCGLACVVMSAILLFIAFVTRKKTQKGSVARRIVRTMITLASSIAIVCALLVGGLFALVSTPYLLSTASPSGDRVLVVENSFLLLSSQDIYYLSSPWPFAQPSGFSTADNGYDPIANGTYSVEWHNRTADVTFWSDNTFQPMTGQDSLSVSPPPLADFQAWIPVHIHTPYESN